MNRAARRKLAKKRISPEELKEIYYRTKEESIKQAVNAYTLVACLVLHDKWGFGNKRLSKFLSQVNDTFDAIEKDYVSLKDIKKVLGEECKINIK